MSTALEIEAKFWRLFNLCKKTGNEWAKSLTGGFKFNRIQPLKYF